MVGEINSVMRMLGCCDCCCGNDDDEDGHPNLRHGVVKERVPTDIPILLLYIAFNCLLAYFAWSIAFANGGLAAYRGATDYNLNTCGQGDLVDKPWGAWPDLKNYHIIICFESCAATESSTFYAGGYSSRGLGLWCIPNSMTPEIEDFFAKNRALSFVLEVYQEFDNIAMAIPISLFLVVIWLLMIIFCLKVIFACLILMLFGGTGYASYTLISLGPDDPTSYYCGWALLATGIIIACCLGCMWGAIKESIYIMEEGSKGILVMPQITALPMALLPFIIGTFGFWYVTTMAMFSTGTALTKPLPTSQYISDHLYDANDTTYKEMQFSYDMRYSAIANLFWMFWTIKFIQYIQFLSISGAMADWWLNKEIANEDGTRDDGKGIIGSAWANSCLCCSSFCRTFYHTGTALFGAALIAIIQLAEAGLEYWKQQMGETQNPIAIVLIYVFTCLLHCLEWILDRCNKNAMVVTAVIGLPFCGGCSAAFGIFFQNMALLAMCTTLISFFVFCGIFLIALMTTGTIGYFFMGITSKDSMDYSSMSLPLIVIFVIGYTVAYTILNVWDCTCTTVMICDCMLMQWYPDRGNDPDKLHHKAFAKGANLASSSASYSSSGSEEHPEGAIKIKVGKKRVRKRVQKDEEEKNAIEMVVRESPSSNSKSSSTKSP